MMSVDFTAFDAQVAGTAGTAGSASGTIDGGDGGNAIDALPPYSNTDFSLEPSLNRVFPTTIGGNGGAGAGGANSTTTSLAVQGGLGGKGGGRVRHHGERYFRFGVEPLRRVRHDHGDRERIARRVGWRRWRRWRQRRARYHRDCRRERLE
jgi:hypothetical protein